MLLDVHGFFDGLGELLQPVSKGGQGAEVMQEGIEFNHLWATMETKLKH